MIDGTVSTNLDEGQRKKWPKKFVAVPQPGELIRAKGGYTRKVCRVTHYSVVDESGQEKPYIEIEVNRVI